MRFREDGLACRFANKILRATQDIVLGAIEQNKRNGFSVEFADYSFRAHMFVGRPAVALDSKTQ